MVENISFQRLALLRYNNHRLGSQRRPSVAHARQPARLRPIKVFRHRENSHATT
jgi:hypothetical protein